MPIQIPQGYIVTSPEAIDKRFLLTKEEMRRVKDAWMPTLYFTLCADKEDIGAGEQGYKLYLYDKNKEITPDDLLPPDGTGKFSPYAGAYEDLAGLPLINGVKIVGDLKAKDLRLQTVLTASEGISLVDRENDTLLSVLFDHDTLNLNDKGELYVSGLDAIRQLIKEETERAVASEGAIRDALAEEIKRAKTSEGLLDLKKQNKLIPGDGIRITDSEKIEVLFDNQTIVLNNDNKLGVNIDGETIIYGSEGLEVKEENLDLDVNTDFIRLNSEVKELNSEVIVLADLVDSEIEARKLADSELKALLDSEALIRSQADSELLRLLNSEIDARKLADSELRDLLDSEAYFRRLGDSELKDLLDSEAYFRALADSELKDLLDSEAYFRALADSELRDYVNSELAKKQNKLIAGDGITLTVVGDSERISVDVDDTLIFDSEQQLGVKIPVPEFTNSEVGKALVVTLDNSELVLNWATASGGNVDDILIDSESVVKNKIAQIRLGDTLVFGPTSEDSENRLDIDIYAALPDIDSEDYNGVLGLDSEGKLVWKKSAIVETPDWDQDDSEASDFIKHRPAIKRDTSSSSLTPDRNTGVKLNDVTNNTASGDYSVAQGSWTTASGLASHAEGTLTTANGFRSHAEGNETEATGISSHAEGEHTIAARDDQHVQGRYNVEDTAGRYADIVGWGVDDFARKNISSLTTDGDLHLKKEVFINSNDDGTGGLKLVPALTSEGHVLTIKSLPTATSAGELMWKAVSGGGGGNYTGAQGIEVTGANVIQHTNNVTAVTNKQAYKITLDAQGHVNAAPELYQPDWNKSYNVRTNTTDSDYIKNAPWVKQGTDSTKDAVIISTGTASGTNAVAMAGGKATGARSVAEGGGTASSDYSHAEGQSAQAEGRAAHAEGIGSKASDQAAHAEGVYNTASGIASHAEGNGSKATGAQSHAEGYRTEARGDMGSHAEGEKTKAIGIASHAEGMHNTASGMASHAEGGYENGTIIYGTIASGDYGSHAEGHRTEASGNLGSHAEGAITKASGIASHAEGNDTQASGDYGSHAEGIGTKAIGLHSHAEGAFTQAVGDDSHAEGHTTFANKVHSHAEGFNTIADSSIQHVQGAYNVVDSEGKYADIVGWGTDTARKNISSLTTDGDLHLKGKVFINSNDDGTGGYQVLPNFPTADGTYVLKVVVASGTPTLQWVLE